MRAAGLRPGARKALAAEGLHADYGADHAAVHVDIADACFAHDAVDEALDPAVNTEGEAIPGVADPLQQRSEVVAPVQAHMQDRAEHLGSRERLERKLEGDGCHEIP